jgi:hypothetical protein
MTVPKTAINKDNSPMFFQNDIRLAGEFRFESIPKTLSPKHFTNKNFRNGIFSPNPRHAVTTLFGGHKISHKI